MKHYWPEAIVIAVIWAAALAHRARDQRNARRMREAQQPRRIRATYGPGYGLLGWDWEEEQ